MICCIMLFMVRLIPYGQAGVKKLRRDSRMIQKPDDSSLTMAAPWDRRISALLHGVAGFYHRA
ncbi:MAG: hypothetical protein GX556_20870 [Fibrobacter sp.]|nr:hypothetical protein [Fibrobacter sp.]